MFSENWRWVPPSPGYNQNWTYDDVTQLFNMAPKPRDTIQGRFWALCYAWSYIQFWLWPGLLKGASLFSWSRDRPFLVLVNRDVLKNCFTSRCRFCKNWFFNAFFHPPHTDNAILDLVPGKRTSVMRYYKQWPHWHPLKWKENVRRYCRRIKQKLIFSLQHQNRMAAGFFVDLGFAIRAASLHGCMCYFTHRKNKHTKKKKKREKNRRRQRLKY